jgi:predicted DCC family thiol-disulfide oxidoreductase YuxK
MFNAQCSISCLPAAFLFSLPLPYMQDHPILLFDGVCNYCNSWVNFAIRNDKKSVLRFTPLQSMAGQRLKEEYNISPETDSVIMIDHGRTYLYSDAALRMAKYLRWPAKALYALIIFPRFIREFIYKLIAKNRYKWFGKKETCMIPSPEVKNRFLE